MQVKPVYSICSLDKSINKDFFSLEDANDFLGGELKLEYRFKEASKFEIEYVGNFFMISIPPLAQLCEKFPFYNSIVTFKSSVDTLRMTNDKYLVFFNLNTDRLRIVEMKISGDQRKFRKIAIRKQSDKNYYYINYYGRRIGLTKLLASLDPESSVYKTEVVVSHKDGKKYHRDELVKHFGRYNTNLIENALATGREIFGGKWTIESVDLSELEKKE